MGRITRTLALLLLLAAMAGTVWLVYEYRQVTRETAQRIERGAIEAVIASESPVYYDDGITPIGVFFEKTHRQHVPYDAIPRTFIKALVAAEDKRFFEHPGFDPWAIMRAVLANLRAGKVVQGGSTLTQQTAKNIFRREKRTYRAKLKELIQAFLLERNYTKEEILEMYANQFFVTGYGKGLGIAARYFFDKEPQELDLVEAAFIAGSVKAPNRYNPFIQKSEAAKEEVLRLAKARKDYVLAKMLEEHFITRREYEAAVAREVPFKAGRITYGLNVILDVVREQLESDYFQRILKEAGVENLATSGIHITTSVNREIQAAAVGAVQAQLAKLDVRLNGYPQDPPPEALLGDKEDRERPFLARITHLDAANPKTPMVVGWGNGGGIIEFEGLRAMGEAWLQWKQGGGARFTPRHLPSFLANFRVGQPVAVRLRGRKLVLTVIPQLEGAALVLHQGMVKAMVGGFLNRHFNRAVDATRQLGSIFKPLLFAAALQLKWNPLDRLPNRPDVYLFENTLYVPRPDHPPRAEEVSLAWAGVTSENLASVWLLYHLTDRLNIGEFRRLVELVGLARAPQESLQAYRKRIRDRHGIVVGEEAIMEAAFDEAKREVESDVIFSGQASMLTALQRLHLRIDRQRLDLERPEEASIVRFDFERLQKMQQNMHREFRNAQRLAKAAARADTDPVSVREGLREALRHFYAPQAGGRRLVYAAAPPAPDAEGVDPEWFLQHADEIAEEEVLVDGLLSAGVLNLLQASMEKHLRRLHLLNPYSLDVLAKIRDFRTLVNLRYVIHLAREMGIRTELEPSLSFPLGGNSIRLVDAARAYHTLMTGSRGSFVSALPGAPIIQRIVDREGRTLWEYRPVKRRVLSGRVRNLVADILRNVMERGTGRGRRGVVEMEVKEAGQSMTLKIPTFGKTGTANRFTNACFVGFVPGPEPPLGPLRLEEGYVIAAYVGYDDNRPMKQGPFAVYGANGALPVWAEIARGVVNRPAYRDRVQLADLVFSPNLSLPAEIEGRRRVAVDPASGLPGDALAQKAPHTARILSEFIKGPEGIQLIRRFDLGGAP